MIDHLDQTVEELIKNTLSFVCFKKSCQLDKKNKSFFSNLGPTTFHEILIISSNWVTKIMWPAGHLF